MYMFLLWFPIFTIAFVDQTEVSHCYYVCWYVPSKTAIIRLFELSNNLKSWNIQHSYIRVTRKLLKFDSSNIRKNTRRLMYIEDDVEIAMNICERERARRRNFAKTKSMELIVMTFRPTYDRFDWNGSQCTFWEHQKFQKKNVKKLLRMGAEIWTKEKKFDQFVPTISLLTFV